jgi:capsular exopolysaccharide synthesis family protein
LEDERGRIESRIAYCASMLQRLRSSDDIRNFPPPTGFDEPALNSLIIDISRLNAEIDAESVNAGVKNSPAFIAKQRKRKNLIGQLEQLAESVLERAQSDMARTRSRISEISYQLGQKPKAERIISQADREMDLRGGVYTYLMEKKAEAGIAIASDEVDKTIVDDARVVGGGAIGPSKKIVLGGALFIGLLLPFLLILGRDFFSDRIADLDELRRASNLPVLAVIPSSKRKRVMPDEPKSMLAESFRTARVNLQYLNAQVARQVIGFTSGTSGEGKTFCAINLASVMALSGRRVLLIDADMRRPAVARELGLAEGAGLSTWLIGEATMEQIVRSTDVPGLEVITAGPIPPNPAEISESSRMAELIQQMRGRYDHVIIDASPIGLVSEFVVLMGHLDITLYVVREGHTRRTSLRGINELAATGKASRVDLLLNDMKADKADGYGYYTK